MKSVAELRERFKTAVDRMDGTQRLGVLAMAFQVRRLLPVDRAYAMGNGLYWIEDVCVGRSAGDSDYPITAPGFVYDGINDAKLADEYLSAALHVAVNFLAPLADWIISVHQYTQDEMLFMLSRCPLVDQSHTRQCVKALLYGALGDYSTAAQLCVTQIEHMVRFSLENNGFEVNTKDGRPKGLGALLLDRTMSQSMALEPLKEMIYIFTASEKGMNVRNLFAHGNLTDRELEGIETFYIWWLFLRIVVSMKTRPKLK